MLTLTKRTDYALIALTFLARHRNEVANARTIAERHHVPQFLLMNLLKTLTQSGLIRSVRGARGGYALAVEPADVSLYDVIVAVEGPVQFVQCAVESTDSAGSSCELLDSCPISGPARRIHDRLEKFLKDVRLAEIAGDACCCGHENAESRVPLAIGPMESKG